MLCRRSLPCLFTWIQISITLFMVFSMFLGVYGRRKQFTKTCNMTSEYLSNLERLMQRVHIILDQHHIDHWLCYGSLWGQIRRSAPMLTADRGHFCLMANQVLAIHEGHFYHSFQSDYLKLRHFAADGVYVVERNHYMHPVVELILFQRDTEQNVYKRVGWKRRLLPPNCEWTPSLDCFPTNLIQLPLPQAAFGRYSLPVPMGGIELQKYHFVDNWWKTVTTKNCD